MNNDFALVGKTHPPVIIEKLAESVRAPFYFYDIDFVLERAQWFRKYSEAKIHYAMKANAEIRLLQALAKADFGVDVVSFGEVKKALEVGFKSDKVLYSGVAKSREDLERAIELGVGQINVESLSELNRLIEMKRPVTIALRVNLAMEVPTHPYIQTSAKRNKFGISLAQLDEAFAKLRAQSSVHLQGLSIHIGSQIMDLSAFAAMVDAAADVVFHVREKGFDLESLDLGGGLGIDYTKDEDDEVRVKAYLEVLNRGLEKIKVKTVQLEPGRILVARAGLLIAKVEYLKPTPDADFLILNTGIHHLLRPALYNAFHRIQPLRLDPRRMTHKYDIVGLLCESSDCFAKDYVMQEMREGEWVAIREAGAYGRVMASTYNESPLPREIVFINNRVEGV